MDKYKLLSKRILCLACHYYNCENCKNDSCKIITFKGYPVEDLTPTSYQTWLVRSRFTANMSG